jgi:hypothetical protein
MFQHYDLSNDNLYSIFMFSLELFEVSELILLYYFIDELFMASTSKFPFSQTKATSLCY